MFDPSKSRDNPLNWSLRLGRLSRIEIRVHLFFIIWIIVQLVRDAREGTLASGAVLALFFFVIVLIHEFGHCFGARAVGGDAETILMWPLGGLATVQVPHNARANFITTAAGPLVNVVFCVLTLLLMALLGGLSELPLNPLALYGPSGSPFSTWGLKDWLVAFWLVNYILLLFNLLPIFPMDGGRILQAVLWRYQGHHKATSIATFVGMIGAVLLGMLGMITEEYILVCIAIFGYITCMQQRQMLKSGMLEAEGGFAESFSVEQTEPTWLETRRERKAAARAEREQREVEVFEATLNAVLEKVSREGLEALSAAEHRILESSTQRKRRE